MHFEKSKVRIPEARPAATARQRGERKAEIRRPKPIQAARWITWRRAVNWNKSFRASDFGFLSDFGLRASDFAWKHSLRSMVTVATLLLSNAGLEECAPAAEESLFVAR